MSALSRREHADAERGGGTASSLSSVTIIGPAPAAARGMRSVRVLPTGLEAVSGGLWEKSGGPGKGATFPLGGATGTAAWGIRIRCRAPRRRSLFGKN